MRIAIVLLATLTSAFAANDFTVPLPKKHDKGEHRALRQHTKQLRAALAKQGDFTVPLPHKPNEHDRKLESVGITPPSRRLAVPEECMANEAFTHFACINYPASGIMTFFDACSSVAYTEDLFIPGNCADGCRVAPGTDPNNPGPECDQCTICTDTVAYDCEGTSGFPTDLAECTTCSGDACSDSGPDDRTDGQPTGLTCEFEYGSTTSDQPTGFTCEFVYGGPRTDDPPSECTDMPGWVDSWGDGCDWYGEDPTVNCEMASSFANAGVDATEACCVCGGGTQ